MKSYNFTGDAKEENKINFKDPQKFLKSKFQKGCFFGQDELIKDGEYKEMGWSYDFRPFLKKYLIKQYGDWREVFAPNKTLLRKAIYGNIEKIVEI